MRDPFRLTYGTECAHLGMVTVMFLSKWSGIQDRFALSWFCLGDGEHLGTDPWSYKFCLNQFLMKVTTVEIN